MKIDTDALKKQVILHLPYLLFLLVFAKLGEAVRLAPGADASQKLLGLSEGFSLAFQSMWPGAALDWLVGLCGAVIVRLAVYLKGKDAKKYRKNVEYGSARWGNKTDIAPFIDPKPENNIILTQTEGLMMSGRPKNPAHARNKNVLVVGGSGSGKTRFFIKPNLMQMHSSYVVTDPKGTVLIEVGKLLSRGTPKLDKDGNPVRGKNGKIVYEPYKIKVFNTINFSKSMHYNPFAYIHNEKDILKLVTVLIANTKGEGKSGDDFWVKAETLLYTALIGYIYYEAPTNEQNFSTLVEMINAMESGRMTKVSKMPLTFSLTHWNRKTRTTSPYASIKNTNLRRARQQNLSLFPAVPDLPPSTLRKSGRSLCMTSWSLTWLEIGKRRCFYYQRYGRDLQFPCQHGLYAVVQSAVRACR